MGIFWGANSTVRAQYFAALLYPRTGYLESIDVKGSIWANPASLGDITTTTCIFSNVAPLGDRYVIATARVLFPIHGQRWRFAAGVLGYGPYHTGFNQSYLGSAGLSSSGSFFFSQPNIHAACAFVSPLLGQFGTLLAVGWESNPDDNPANNVLYANFHASGGWLSPVIAKFFVIGIALVITSHHTASPYAELEGKFGIRARFPGDGLRLCMEGTLSPTYGDNAVFVSSGGYEMAKLLASLRVYGPVAVLAGFSTDLGRFSKHTIGREDNGNCLHAGIEVRQSQQYAFFGGYDMGISTTWIPRLFHRIWLAYSFLKGK